MFFSPKGASLLAMLPPAPPFQHLDRKKNAFWPCACCLLPSSKSILVRKHGVCEELNLLRNTLKKSKEEGLTQMVCSAPSPKHHRSRKMGWRFTRLDLSKTLREGCHSGPLFAVFKIYSPSAHEASFLPVSLLIIDRFTKT
jgi:hypothetical protein